MSERKTYDHLIGTAGTGGVGAYQSHAQKRIYSPQIAQNPQTTRFLSFSSKKRRNLLTLLCEICVRWQNPFFEAGAVERNPLTS